VDGTHRILAEGTGADKQLQVFTDTGDLVSVTDFIQSRFLA